MRIIIWLFLFLPVFSAGQASRPIDTAKEKIFSYTDTMPVFPGGLDSLTSYLSRHVAYPPACIDSNIAGTVYVLFVVDTEGFISNVNVAHKVHPLLDAEAKRVVSTMPVWTPGIYNGHNVNVSYTIPIQFRLSVDQKPQFPGGMDSMFSYIAKNVHFPSECRDTNVTVPELVPVTVYVQFTVDTQGHIFGAKVSHPESPCIDYESVRVITGMPAWKPGVKGGSKANCDYTIPINLKASGAGVQLDTSSKEKVLTKEKVFTLVEHMPEFPGGSEGLLKFIAKHTVYPLSCKRNGIEGTVYVQFIVTHEGHIAEAKVLRKIDPDLDAEALRVVNSLPDWKPGVQLGKTVNVFFTIPIHFQLTR